MHLRRLGSSSRSGSTVSRISTLVLLATFPILSASCGGDSVPLRLQAEVAHQPPSPEFYLGFRQLPKRTHSFKWRLLLGPPT